MQKRQLGRTGRTVGVVGLGCWQLGADWGEVGEDDAMATLHAAADSGVTFFDTADVYGDGRSEGLVGRLLRERPGEDLVVATKMGRRADPHVPEAFTAEALRAWNDRSRENLGVETLDLVQLHCPPTPVYSTDEVFDELDTMVEEGRMCAYGVSVETCAEALTAIARPHVASVQIILNIFRRKPFDEGETFSGVPFEVGVAAARDVAALAPSGTTTAQLALRWVVDQPGVSVVIPGARTPEQARANAEATDVQELDALERIYDEQIREHVHDRW